ncbi:MAG: hypothetical protein SFZ23_10330 [Planctomycetota bacterium]|nr:hypothetical protein [Planctomycetota bacterium]
MMKRNQNRDAGTRMGGGSASWRDQAPRPLRAFDSLGACALLGVAGILAGCAAKQTSEKTNLNRAQAFDQEPGNTDPLKLRDIMRAGRVPPVGGPTVTNPDEAQRWRRLSLVDEQGQIPEGALLRAWSQRHANAAYWASQPSPQDGGISPDNWTFRGPSNIGGRTRALLVDPTTPNVLIAGAVGGGIWRSTNSGATWIQVDDRLRNLAICSLERDPQNPNIICAGTGEGYFNGDALSGTGIYKSIDRGLTWTLMPSTQSFDNVCRIAVSPADSNRILVAKRYGGVLLSTNAGASWTTAYGAQGSFFVDFNPSDPTRAIAHVIDYDFSSSQWFHRALYSTNAGQTWQPAASGLTRVNDFNSRIELSYAPSDPNIVYASCGASGGKVWRSNDGGVNYTLQTSETASTSVGWYYNAIWVDPTNPNTLLVGAYHISRSINAGQSFTQVSNGYINTTQPHPDVHLFVTDPGFNGTTNRRVYVTTDGGVHRTDNVYTASTSAGWSSLQPSYNASQFYGAAGQMPSNRVVGGTQDNGTLRVIGSSTSATLTFGGDGGFCAVDPGDPNFMYGEYVNLQIHRSTNGGASASYIYNGIADAGTNANFIAPFVLDTNDPNRMLAGGRSLWRSNNVKAATPSWAAIKPAGDSNISAIAIAQGNSDVVWVGQNNGKLYRTSNATAANPVWTTIDDNTALNPLPNRYPTRIVIDPDNHARVYVAFGGFSPNNLFRTADNGASFVDVTGTGVTGLPDAPIRGIARHPRRPGWLYAGTQVGVFTSTDDGDTWSTTNQGPANVSVDELVFMHNSDRLLAATHGRGMWTIDVPACPADFDQNGQVDFFDYLGFSEAYAGGATSADFNRDGQVDFFDYLDFSAAYAGPC